MLRIILAALILAVSHIVSAQVPANARPDSTQLASLHSLEKIKDELYLMDYKAAYYFGEFSNKGIGDLDFDGFVEKYLDTKPDSSLWACSALMVTNQKGEVFVGRNFDWEDIPGMILFTDPDSGFSSVSMVPLDILINKEASSPEDNMKLLWAPWFPVEGMNERGLVIAGLAVEGESVRDTSRLSMLSQQLIRLVLDNAASVNEAIALLGMYNNASGQHTHFFIADSTGSSAVVEYMDEEMLISGNEDPYQVVTNDIVYKTSPKRLSRQCSRYNYMYQYLSSHHAALSGTGIMMVLRSVAVEKAYSAQSGIHSSTQWSVIYDIGERSIDVYSRKDYRNRYHYDLNGEWPD